MIQDLNHLRAILAAPFMPQHDQLITPMIEEEIGARMARHAANYALALTKKPKPIPKPKAKRQDRPRAPAGVSAYFRPARQLSDAEIAGIVAAIKSGEAKTNVAARFGIGHKRLVVICADHGISLEKHKRAGRPSTPTPQHILDRREQARQMYSEGVPVKDIAARFGKTENLIRRDLRLMGVKITQQGGIDHAAVADRLRVMLLTKSMRQAAMEIGISFTSAQRIARKYGIEHTASIELRAKLEEDAREARVLRAQGMSVPQIARILGRPERAVWAATTGKTFREAEA